MTSSINYKLSIVASTPLVCWRRPLLTTMVRTRADLQQSKVANQLDVKEYEVEKAVFDNLCYRHIHATYCWVCSLLSSAACSVAWNWVHPYFSNDTLGVCAGLRFCILRWISNSQESCVSRRLMTPVLTRRGAVFLTRWIAMCCTDVRTH